MSQKNPKLEWGYYAITPRVVRTQYKQLSHTEKWLYVCLKDLCGDHGTCYRTLKALSQETDLSTGNLSLGIRHLHDAGLIHAEKKRRSHKPTSKEVWHITIVDIWQSNIKECSKYERCEDNVQNMNDNVQNMNNPDPKRSKFEPKRSNFVDRSNNSEEEHFEERTESVCGTPEDSSSPNPSPPPEEEHTHISSLLPKNGELTPEGEQVIHIYQKLRKKPARTPEVIKAANGLGILDEVDEEHMQMVLEELDIDPWFKSHPYTSPNLEWVFRRWDTCLESGKKRQEQEQGQRQETPENDEKEGVEVSQMHAWVARIERGEIDISCRVVSQYPPEVFALFPAHIQEQIREQTRVREESILCPT